MSVFFMSCCIDLCRDYCDTSVQDFWHQLSKLPCGMKLGRGGYLIILVSAAHGDVICGSFVPPELDLSPSDWPEIKALQAHEWLQR